MVKPNKIMRLKMQNLRQIFHHKQYGRNFSSSAVAITLTQEQLTKINRVIPRLCSSNHLKDAIRLISVAVLTPNPPIDSLPLPILINRLALEPDLTFPMYFLNSLKYNDPNLCNVPPVVPSIAKMFVSSFFENAQPRKALEIFHWVSRPDLNFPVGVASELGFYNLLIDGFCRNGMILDSVRVLRAMMCKNLVVGIEVKKCLYRGLLREARIREALDLNDKLDCFGVGNDYDTASAKEIVDLLDRIITNWVE